MEFLKPAIAFTAAVRVANFICQRRPWGDQAVLHLDPSTSLSEEEMKYLFTIAFTFCLLYGYGLFQDHRRQAAQQRRLHNREYIRQFRQRLNLHRRMEQSSTESAASFTERQHWQDAHVALKQELGPLSEMCGDGEVQQRPVLPTWLHDVCRNSIRRDKQEICELLFEQGNDEEVGQYIRQHGMHPRDYGLNLQQTMQFFSQHNDLVAAMHHQSSVYALSH